MKNKLQTRLGATGQLSFASAEFAGKKRVTRREAFLERMQGVVPWARLEAVIEPYYPKAGGHAGRPPVGLGRMLRMYCLQQWFGLSDEGLEDTIYDSQAMRMFLGLDLAVEDVPDATTLLKFRRLLETHGLTKRLMEEIGAHLQEKGLLLREGTLVDATIIEAPSSTKNREHARDPEMHQTKKGNQWHFGMKVHVGVDMASGLVHSAVVSAANDSDVAHAADVLHGDEKRVYADAGYQGVEKRAEVLACQAEGSLPEKVQWNVAQRRHKLQRMAEGPLKELTRALERTKAQIRSRVEHVFQVLKRQFHYTKARYRGLAKNEAQVYSLLGLVNLELACRPTVNRGMSVS